MRDEPPTPTPVAAVRRLAFLDRYLTVWIFAAMATGVAIGRFAPGAEAFLGRFRVGTTSIPLAVGLILMMIPPLAKVRYEALPAVFHDWKTLGLALFQSWIVGPAVMFALAATTLSDRPEFFAGLVLVGIAPCIAMVIVWNALAEGDAEYAAALVALNSILQITLYAGYAWLLLDVLPPYLGLEAIAVNVGIGQIAATVAVYLGIPLVAGFMIRSAGLAILGRDRYEQDVLPAIAPVTLVALLATIVVMFALQGNAIVGLPLEVVRIALPLLAFFAIMFFATFALAWASGADYSKTATVALTASSNNFELAIAVAIGVFGISSGAALAAVIGPLVEVPVLVGLVRVSLWLRQRLFVAASGPLPAGAVRARCAVHCDRA